MDDENPNYIYNKKISPPKVYKDTKKPLRGYITE
jgi:hypothetical protein